MRRRLLNLITLASAVLFALVLAASIASFWRAPFWEHETSRTVQSEVAGSWDRRYDRQEWVFGRGGLYHARGSITVEGLPHEADGAPQESSALVWGSLPSYPLPRTPGGQWLGFAWSAGFDWRDEYFRAFTVPVWPLLVLLGTGPATWCVLHARARRREIRSSRGMCRACGYDLRASPERCPECGATVGGSGPADSTPAAAASSSTSRTPPPPRPAP